MSKCIFIYGMNYAPEIAGVGRYTGEIGEHLAVRGHDVCVITTPPHYPGWKVQTGYFATRWTREVLSAVHVYRCPLYLHPEMHGIRRLLAPLSFAISSAPIAIWQILKRRPDVVIVVEPSLLAAPVALLAARLVGAKTLLHVQDLEVEAAFAIGHLSRGGAMALLGSWFDCNVTQKFDRIVTISNRMGKKIESKGVAADRIQVIRNWVDVEKIHPLSGPSPYRRELGLSDSAFVVLYAGNLGAKQGINLIIAAAERLSDELNIVFIIAGDGPMRPTVKAAAERLGNIRLLPFQPMARFCDLLGLADVHILPQEAEAADLLLPSKLGGMLASGRRIIAVAHSGTELADFLGLSCAFTPPGDAALLEQTIRTMASEPAMESQTSQRLALASTRLSKAVLIECFAAAALFETNASGSNSKDSPV